MPPVTFCMHVQQKRGNFGLLDRPDTKGTNETPNQMNHNANTTTDRRRGRFGGLEGRDRFAGCAVKAITSKGRPPRQAAAAVGPLPTCLCGYYSS